MKRIIIFILLLSSLTILTSCKETTILEDFINSEKTAILNIIPDAAKREPIIIHLEEFLDTDEIYLFDTLELNHFAISITEEEYIIYITFVYEGQLGENEVRKLNNLYSHLHTSISNFFGHERIDIRLSVNKVTDNDDLIYSSNLTIKQIIPEQFSIQVNDSVYLDGRMEDFIRDNSEHIENMMILGGYFNLRYSVDIRYLDFSQFKYDILDIESSLEEDFYTVYDRTTFVTSYTEMLNNALPDLDFREE